MRDGVIVHPVRFVFMGPEEMARASRQADLYVHAARIEVEGLGALEVLRHGVVPVLACGSLTGTRTPLVVSLSETATWSL